MSLHEISDGRDPNRDHSDHRIDARSDGRSDLDGTGHVFPSNAGPDGDAPSDRGEPADERGGQVSSLAVDDTDDGSASPDRVVTRAVLIERTVSLYTPEGVRRRSQTTCASGCSPGWDGPERSASRPGSPARLPISPPGGRDPKGTTPRATTPRTPRPRDISYLDCDRPPRRSLGIVAESAQRLPVPGREQRLQPILCNRSVRMGDRRYIRPVP
jgi:hypothetical protein